MKKKKKEIHKSAIKVPVKPVENPPGQKGIGKAGFSLKYRLAIFCAAVGFLLYVNTVNFDYTGDDGMVIKNNKITTQGVKAIPEIFKTGYRAGFWDRKENFYRPLSLVMFAAEYQLSPGNPHVGHWVNAIVYALTGFVLFLALASLMQGNLIIPLVASLLYITHPLHTEVISNIKSRDEILSLFFTLCSFYFLSIYIHRKTWLSMLLGGFLFFLALLSKESAITCVAAVPLICWFFGRGMTVKRMLLPFLTYISASLLYMIIRYIILQGFTNFEQIATINNSLVAAPDFLSRLATAVMILGKYLLLLFFPHPLTSDYSYNQIPNVGFGNMYVLLSLLVYIAIIIYAIIQIRSKNLIAFGILFFLVSISLVSNVFFLIESVMAERFLYLASFGFCISFAVLLTKIFKTNVYAPYNSIRALLKNNSALFGVVAVILILFSFKTISRNADWKNDLSLFKKDAQLSPESARVRYAYGRHLLVYLAQEDEDAAVRNADLDKAIEQLEKSVSIYPAYGDAYYYLGVAYKQKGNNTSAITNFELARKNQYYEDSEFNLQLGIAYQAANQLEKAIEEYKKAIELNPQSYDAYLNLGVTYDNVGKYEESISSLKRAVEINPQSYKPYYNIGYTSVHLGRFNDAIEWFKKSVELNPKSDAAFNNIANCYVSMKDYNKALEYYSKAMEISPRNASTLANIGFVYRLMGNNAEAAKYEQLAKASQNQ